MIYPYLKELERRRFEIELAELTEANIKAGVTSTKLKVKPAYFLPNGKLYYVTTNHHNADFYSVIDDTLNILESFKQTKKIHCISDYSASTFSSIHLEKQKSFYIMDDTLLVNSSDILFDPCYEEIYSFLCQELQSSLKCFQLPNDVDYYIYRNHLEDKVKRVVLEYQDDFLSLQRRNRYLQEDFKKISNHQLSLHDVRSYLNYNCFSFDDFCRHSGDETGFYNDRAEEVVLGLISAKMLALDGLLSFVREGINPQNCGKEVEEILQLPRNYTIESECDSSKLMIKQSYSILNPDFMGDLSTMAFGFDKIESAVCKTITSSRLDLYQAYFNYYLMDYHLCQLPRIQFDSSTGHFMKLSSDEFSLSTYKDNKYKEEAELIKKKVPRQERNRYFL